MRASTATARTEAEARYLRWNRPKYSPASEADEAAAADDPDVGGESLSLSARATPAQVVRCSAEAVDFEFPETSSSPPTHGDMAPGCLVAAKRVLWFTRCHWRRLLALVAPVLLSPLLILHDSKETRCAYVILLMAVYWMFEVVHLSVTSLLPVCLFPLFGVLDTASATAPYMKDAIMMYLAGMIIATAVENCNLHYRIAIRILLIIGTKTLWLLLGFMVTSMFLSMWLSNMATTLMVLPIVDAVVNEICKKNAEENLKNSCTRTRTASALPRG